MAEVLALMTENPDAVKLLSYLKASGMETQRQDYGSLVNYIDTIESQYNSIIKELTELKSQISGIKDTKNPITVMAGRMESTVLDIGARLRSIKDSIISFTKNALDTIRDKGLSALNTVSGFIKVKDNLQAMSGMLEKSTASAENSIEKIEAMSRQYHEIGNNAKNIGRIFIGRETNEEIKTNGKLAKAMELPFIGIKNAYAVINEMVNKATLKIESLEKYNIEKVPQVKEDINEIVTEKITQSDKTAEPSELTTMLTELQSELSKMSSPELLSMYQELLETGKNSDLTTDENTILQATVEKIETMLPYTEEHDAAEFLDLEQTMEM